jgi:hypothetical protein
MAGEKIENVIGDGEARYKAGSSRRDRANDTLS